MSFTARRDHARARRPDWPRLVAQSTRSLQRHLAASRDKELTPAQVARCVLAAVPPVPRRSLWHALRCCGWLSARAHIPANVLDGAACPPAFHGPQRELVRLAVFGLPGQGRVADVKHREATYQQLCAQIMREATDLPTLTAAAQRAANHADVRNDPTLESMLRSFVATREAELRVEEGVRSGGGSDESQVRVAFSADDEPAPDEVSEIVLKFERARTAFQDCCQHFDEPGAQAALGRLRRLCTKHAALLNTSSLQQCTEALERLTLRCNRFRSQIDELVARATAAAARGESVLAGWALRRMAAINALRPALLPDEQFAAIRRRIEVSSDEEAHREVAAALLARERSVAAELRQLAAVIRQFHKIAREVAPEDPTYRRAEAAYRQAVAALELRDGDWMAGLVLELSSMLDDIDDRSGAAERQVDHFVSQVRASLQALREEIPSRTTRPTPRG